MSVISEFHRYLEQSDMIIVLYTLLVWMVQFNKHAGFTCYDDIIDVGDNPQTGDTSCGSVRV